MAQEYVEYEENVSVIQELDKLVQELVKQKIAKVTHDSINDPDRKAKFGEPDANGRGTFGTKKFEIDREIFYKLYNLEQWSILEPFDDPLKIIDIKFWYNYRLNRAGVKINKKDTVMLIKLLVDALKVHHKLTGNGSNMEGILKMMRPLPDHDQQ